MSGEWNKEGVLVAIACTTFLLGYVLGCSAGKRNKTTLKLIGFFSWAALIIWALTGW